MATRVQWKRFGFFDKDIVEENIENVLGTKPCCAASEGGMLLFGDPEGYISLSDGTLHISDRKHKCFRGPVCGLSFIFDSTNQMKQFVIAVGDETRGQSDDRPHDYFVKVFSAGDMSRPLQAFPAAAANVPPTATLTSFSVLADGSQIAAGFSNGAVLLFLGNFVKEGPARPPATQVLLPNHPCPVSGLHFCELTSIKPSERRIRIFAVFDTPNGLEVASNSRKKAVSPDMMEDPDDAGILVLDSSVVMSPSGPTPSAQRRFPHTLDARGAAAGCSSLMKDTRELLIGREEGVFSYSVEDRGGAAGFEFEKQCVTTVGRYVLVASVEDKSRRTNITIYDFRNKFIGANSLLPAGERVLMAMHDGGTAFVVTSTWSLIRFREKDTASKIEVLLRKSLYPLAISLAAEEQCEVSEIMKLYKLYGDHLYKKSEYDAAIAQYCNTVGYVQPSYIVRRFLDPHRISNLIQYLEKLWEVGLATKDHTTLLLTCYTKLKDEAKVAVFVEKDQKSSLAAGSSATSGTTSTGAKVSHGTTTLTPSAPGGFIPGLGGEGFGGTGKDDGTQFDVSSAIDILQTAGFTEHALKLAQKHRQHSAFIRIQLLKSPPNISASLAYLAALVFDPSVTSEEFRGIIMSQGKLLLDHTGRGPLAGLSENSAEPTSATGAASAAGNNAGNVTEPFIELLIKLCIPDYSSLIPSKGSSSVPAGCLAANFKGAAAVTANEIIHLFVDDKSRLKLLLEGVYEGLKSKTRLVNKKITTTLMEMYLRDYQARKRELRTLLGGSTASGVPSSPAASLESSRSPSSLKQEIAVLEEKVMGLLDGLHVEYDPSHALLLTHEFGFSAGEQFLLEQSQSVELLVQMHVESGNDRGLFRILRREGRKDPALFVQILTYFVKKVPQRKRTPAVPSTGSNRSVSRESESDNGNDDDADDDERWDEVSDVLALIEKDHILSPMQVIGILSLHPELPLRIVNSYIQATLHEVGEEVAALEKDVVSIQAVVNSVVQENAARNELSPSTKLEKRHLTRPIHSSSGEFEDEELEEFQEIAQCEEKEQANEHQQWIAIKQGFLERSENHEIFFAELESSGDGFSTVASYFGKALISQ